jgi:hypothetical protein
MRLARRLNDRMASFFFTGSVLHMAAVPKVERFGRVMVGCGQEQRA